MVRTVVVDHGSVVLYIATAVGAAAGLLALWTAARTVYRNSVGRRWDRYRRIARLGTGAQLSFFVSVLGEPPAMQRTIVNTDYVELVAPEDLEADPEGFHERYRTVRFKESTFIDRDYYVQAISDHDDTVLAFSVTTRSVRFRPRFQGHRRLGRVERWRWHRGFGVRYHPLFDITLGQTSFADLDPANPNGFVPPHFLISMGAHNHAYSEIRYFGNPGNYQTFVFTASDAARQGRFGNGMAVWAEVGDYEWPDPEKPKDGQPEWANMPETHRFRHDTVITTYTVISNSLSLRNYPTGRFGPNENDVRTLP
jgi:hypothetical protein